MPIISDIERQSHIARLIPNPIWRNLFRRELTDFELELMKRKSEDIMGTLSIDRLNTHVRPRGDWIPLSDGQLHRCTWLAIAFAHPELTDIELQAIATQVALSEESLLEVTCALGRVSLFEMLVKESTLDVLQRMIQGNDSGKAFMSVSVFLSFGPAKPKPREEKPVYDYNAFTMAARCGHSNFVDRLAKLAPDHVQAMLKSEGHAALLQAVLYGHEEMVKHLFRLADSSFPQKVIAEAFKLGAEHGHWDVMAQILACVTPEQAQIIILSEGAAAFASAACAGYLHVMEKLMAYAPDHVHSMIAGRGQRRYPPGHPSKEIQFSYDAFRMSASMGHLKVVQCLIELTSNDEREAMLRAGRFAWFSSTERHLPVIEYLFQFSSVLAHAALCDHLFCFDALDSFVRTQMEHLKEKITAPERIKSGLTFDIPDHEEAKRYYAILYFYLKHFSKFRERALNDIQTIITIPSINRLINQGYDYIANPYRILPLVLKTNDSSAYKMSLKNVRVIHLEWAECVTLLNYTTLPMLIAAFPPSLTTLILGANFKNTLSLEGLLQLAGAFPNIQKLYIGQQGLDAMSIIERTEFKAIFPNIKQTILLDQSGEIINKNDPIARVNTALRYDLPVEFPSLFSVCSFFVKRQTNPLPIESIPLNVQTMMSALNDV